ncbi:MAG: hypothetical protein IPP90_08075 [Gemmatimonadaceae bacterium]|nr:hypothetical protein [Gemmatimonadaceae bacterium]
MTRVRTCGQWAGLLAMTTAVAGCHRTVVSATELASRVTVSTCPPGIVPATITDAPPLALLTVTLRTVPPIAAGIDASLRLDGETTRNSLRVDPTLPQPFSLAKGVYVVRVSLPGYVGVEGRANLTAGCEATMTMELKQR